MRVTYDLLVDDSGRPENPGDYLEIVATDDGDYGVQVRNLVAPKHILHQYDLQTTANVQTVTIEYHEGRELFETSMLHGLTAFHPPTRFGLFISASLDSDPRAVTEFVNEMGFAFDTSRYREVQTDDYFSWAIPLSAVRKHDRVPSAVALRIAVSNGVVTQNEWYFVQKWNELLTEADEVGTFEYEYDPEYMLLTGRVFNKAKHQTLGKFDQENVSEPMMFRWYYKHVESYPSYYTPSLNEPYGLHPKLQLDLLANDESLPSACRLYALVDLPTDLFFDAYELKDLVEQDPAAELVALWGDNDLEKPQWQANEAVSALFQLHNFTYTVGQTTRYTIPMHTRYQRPQDSERTRGSIVSPHVFWACLNDDIPVRSAEFIQPCEYMGIESVFPIDRTQFVVMSSTNDVLYEIPAITAEAQSVVEHSTMVVILLGAVCVFVSVLMKIFAKTPKIKVE